MSHLTSSFSTFFSRFSGLLLAGLLLGGCTQATEGPGNNGDAQDEPVACESPDDAHEALDAPCADEGDQCVMWGDEVNTAMLVCVDGFWTYQVFSNISSDPCPGELPDEGAGCSTGAPSQFGPLFCEYSDITAVCPAGGGSWSYEMAE